MGQQERAEIERLWTEQLARPFPPNLRGAEVGAVDPVLLDANIAGCVSSWLSSERLDPDRQRILARCLDEAQRVARLLPIRDDAEYFGALRDLARSVLDAEGVSAAYSPPRTYLACRWIHSNADDPVLILAELDGERYEVRKVHQFADGRLERADRILDANTSLSWVATPSEAEIAAQEEFEVRPLTGAEFEDYWRRAEPDPLSVLLIDGPQ